MIKLSDMLAATLDDKDPLIALQINEAKRLEALDVPHNPVATFTTERPHEWVIYRGGVPGFHWHGGFTNSAHNPSGRWHSMPTDPGVRRFPTDTDAQTYIDSNKLWDAYPWPVPKLS